jgi:hypothetical protein
LIVATQYQGAMAEGSSLPQLFTCGDGKGYVVKFMSNPQGIRGLANELIAYRLGKLLDLPVVPGEVIYLTEDFIDSVSKLKKQRVQPGPHFGSLFLQQAQEPNKQAISNCINLDQFTGMIVFDHWIKNGDRSSENIILTAGDRPTFYMIDHNGCFCGSGWTAKRLLRNSGHVEPYWAGMYARFARYLDQHGNPFSTSLDRLEALSRSMVREVMYDIPKEWGVKQEDFDVLAEFLERRKSLVRGAIVHLKRHFPRWSS